MKIIISIIMIFASIANSQTTSQIKQAKKMFESSGMSKSDAIKVAKSKGFSDDQINNAILKEQNLKEVEESKQFDEVNQNLFEKSNNDIIEPTKPEIGISDDNNYIDQNELEVIEDSYFSIESKQSTFDNSNKYFGYEIFSRDPGIFQSSSAGTVPPNYTLGPGDEIIIMLWGETQFRQVFKVDREGFIFIPEIGQVFVNGLNLNMLESKLFKGLSQFYASMNPSGRKATTFLDVSIGNLRPLRIQVLGELSQPGAYTVSPSATLFSSLYYFNGPTELGSLRDIRLIRDGKDLVSIDFYDYLLTGKKPRDENLQVDDVIFIPKRKKTVKILGEVNRPGIYELKEGETLRDIISMSGELKISAYLERIQIDRIVPFEQRDEVGMDRLYNDVNLGELLNSDSVFELQDGDIIQVFSVLDVRQNIVEIIGAVSRPGKYDLGDSLSLTSLLEKADGLLGDAYTDRIDVIRIKSDFTEKLIKINLNNISSNNPLSDLNLKALDRIRVYSTSEMVPKKYVSLIGHVKKPGRYLLQENMTLFDLIFKGGGFFDKDFKRKAYLNRAELIRSDIVDNSKKITPFNLDKVLNSQDIFNLELQRDDVIRVYSVNEIEGGLDFVNLNGHVKIPGRYELFEKNMRISDILFRGGGFEDKIHRSNTYLKRADLIRYEKDRIRQNIIPFNLKEVLDNNLSLENLKLEDGDEIRIYSKAMFRKVETIAIEGKINKPGNYILKTDMNLLDLILESGGIKDNIKEYSIEISRNSNVELESKTYCQVIIVSSAQEEAFINFLLEPNDFIIIRESKLDLNHKKVIVKGAVKYPGKYVIISEDERVGDIIKRAGGLKANAFGLGSTFSRSGQNIRINLNKLKSKSSDNLVIQDGDIITIAQKPNIVSIKGAVNVPGNYVFDKKNRVKNIIDQAGGFNENANKHDIFITYANGKSKKISRFVNPKAMEGSIITIGELEEKEPFDETEYLKEMTTIFANLAQVISIIYLATK